MSEKKSGRPSKDVIFPTNQETFGIKDLITLNPTVSKVSLQLKANKAVQCQKLKIVGSSRNAKGRPSILFQVA